MPPKKDKKKKDKKAKPTKRTQQQKGKGQSQKQTQIVNINLAKARSRSAPKPVSSVPVNIIRMNEYPQQLASQPTNQILREPLKEVVAPSRLLYDSIPEAQLYTEPSQAIPEASGYAIDPMKPIANVPPSAGARGRPRLSEEEIKKREQYALMMKKIKAEEKLAERQKKAEEKAKNKPPPQKRGRKPKGDKTGGGVPSENDSGYEA